MSKWYNPSKLFSHNAFISMCMSGRGMGKSYSAKKKAIKDFIKTGSQTVYVRRSREEMKKVKDTYFNDIEHEFPNHEFSIEGDVGLIDGSPMIYFIPLSTSSQYKSASYPNVRFLIFDEYIITKNGHNRYLQNEMILFLDLIETVFRSRNNVKILLLSNSVSYVNPLFTYFNIEPVSGKRFQKFKNGLICLELFESKEFLEDKKETDFYKLIEGTEYCKYAIGNETLEDTNDFIISKPKGKYNFVSTIKSNNFNVGIWLHEESLIYFIDKKIDTSSKHKYCLLSTDISEGYKLVREYRNKTWRLREVKKAYANGNLYFDSQEIKKFYQENIDKWL